MNLSRQLAGSVGAALILCFMSLTSVWAQNRNTPALRVKGLITSVGGNSLRMQTSAGSMAFTLPSTVHITRMVIGSTADLASGEMIEAHFVTGTTIIGWIRIDLPRGNHTAPPPRSSGSHDGTRAGTGTRVSHSGRGSGTSHPSTGVEGQLVSMTDRTVTVKGEHGQTATYSLAGNLAVSKVLPGRVSDLAMGETVQVCTARGNATAAVTVTILSS